jgi:hypothetical protein
MENKIWEGLMRVLEQIKPDIPRLGKKCNKHACDRLRKNTWKAIRYLRALNTLANKF